MTMNLQKLLRAARSGLRVLLALWVCGQTASFAQDSVCVRVKIEID